MTIDDGGGVLTIFVDMLYCTTVKFFSPPPRRRTAMTNQTAPTPSQTQTAADKPYIGCQKPVKPPRRPVAPATVGGVIVTPAEARGWDFK